MDDAGEAGERPVVDVEVDGDLGADVINVVIATTPCAGTQHEGRGPRRCAIDRRVGLFIAGFLNGSRWMNEQVYRNSVNHPMW
jgi:hypothetical protein